jgi:hypothetical protein
MRRDTLVYRVQISAVGEADMNVRVLEPKARIDIRGDFVIGPYDIFDVHIDKIVEGVDVLLDQTFDFQECRQ